MSQAPVRYNHSMGSIDRYGYIAARVMLAGILGGLLLVVLREGRDAGQ